MLAEMLTGKSRRRAWATRPAVIILYFAGAVLAGYVGAIVDAAISPWLYRDASMGAFSPLAAIFAAFLGILLSRWRRDRRAIWAWAPGAFWLAFGAYSMLYVGGVLQTGAWPGSTPSRFLFSNLFGAKCGDTECLDEVVFTLPFISAVIYSISSWVTLKILALKDSGLAYP